MSNNHTSSTGTDQLEAQVIRQREALAQTADALSHKLDVKARASDKAHEVKDAATTESGKPRPELLAGAAAVVAAVAALLWWRKH